MVQGRVTPAVSDEIMRRGAAALRQHRANRALYDMRRARMAVPTLSLITRARFADDLGIPKSTRVALLCAVRTPHYELLDTLARNQGHTHQIFTDGAAALAWLRAE